MSWAERRTEPRVVSAHLINYSELLASRQGAPSAEEVYSILGTARTIDLSAGGCRLLCQQPLPLDAQLQLNLQLGNVLIQLVGTVCRSERADGGYTAGVEFGELDDFARDGIRLYLDLGPESDSAE